MLDDPDQLDGGVARQPRIGVERVDVADLLENAPVADHRLEGGVRRASKQSVELLDLPALPLPSHPYALARIPLSRPMEQIEAVLPAVPVTRVERLDPGDRRGQDLLVLGALGLGSVRVVGEQREMKM